MQSDFLNNLQSVDIHWQEKYDASELPDHLCVAHHTLPFYYYDIHH